jgi:hypothetical protein
MKRPPDALLAFTLLMATFVVVSTSVAAMIPAAPAEHPALVCER